MTKASDNAFPSLLITEGTEPSAPAAGKQRLYIDSTSHLLKVTNSSGVESNVSKTELDYVQITSAVSLTATTEGTAHTIITGTSQAYVAEPTLIEVFCPRLTTSANAGSTIVALLFDGATVLGRVALVSTPSAASMIHQVYAAYRLTPTAATHQYIVKAYTTVSGGSWDCGAGGTGVEMPSFLRITRV